MTMPCWPGNPKRNRRCGQPRSCTGADPWHEIESASARERALYVQYAFLENGAGFNSALFRDARLLVRGADERMKPNTDRLREFTEASLPLIERDLYARVPVYPELEQS